MSLQNDNTSHKGEDFAMAQKDAEWHWSEGNKFALEGMKLLFLLNGAAAVTTMTFTGNVKVGSCSTITALVMFGLGAFFSVIALASAYLTQLSYGNANFNADSSDPQLAKWFDIARWWHCAVYAIIVLAAAAFLVGVVFAAVGLSAVAIK